MSQTAVDVVLLPSEAMVDKAIEMNQELLKNNAHKIVLHKKKCLPHISLCMGVINKEQLPAVKEVLTSIAEQFDSFQLKAEGTKVATIPTDEKFSMVKISHPPILQTLHETVMRKLWNYLSYDNIEASMFDNPSEVEEISFHWVKGYAQKYADPSKYHPHLSLGIGESNKKFTFPINFTASKIALCQLGNYCTCRKVLGIFDLSAR